MKKNVIYSIAFLMLSAFYVSLPFKKDTTCTACESLTGVEKIVCLADAFKATLSSTQINTLEYDYTLDNAATWSNLPVSFVPRLGLKFENLTAAQLSAAKTLIEAALGTTDGEGYDEMVGLWAADEYLSQNGGGSEYGDGLYFIAFIGAPSLSGTWELQAGGHHVAVSNTYSNGVMTGATPSFRAAEPNDAFTLSGTTYQPLGEEKSALVAMLAGLSSSELAEAKLSQVFGDISLGPDNDWAFPEVKVGKKCSELTTAQKDLVLAAIATYVDDISDEEAAEYKALYASQIDETYLAYSGNANLNNQKDYVRIDGPRVWIEYSTQNGIILTPKHPHSVWRDHQTDYGGLGNPNPVSTFTPLHEFKGTFNIFPNPIREVVQIELKLESEALVTVQLYDMAGKKVAAECRINSTIGTQLLPLHVSDLPKGTYMCHLTMTYKNGNTQIATRKISKA